MSEPKIEKTGSNCPVCGGDIVSVKRLVDNKPISEMVDGPGGENNFREEQSFHCEDCGILFAFPPQGIIPYRRERPRV